MAMSVGDEQQRRTDDEAVTIGGFRYVRAPRPIHFPVELQVPESKRHLEQRTLLYAFLKHAFGREHSIGCDQFVYWDPTDPRACLAPDAFVRLGEPDSQFKSWKVWERGAPEVAVEVQSDSDEGETWETKLRKYPKLGVRELVAFDPERSVLRVWDFVENDLVERQLSSKSTESRVLPGFWVVLDGTLRLSRDASGQHLFPTPAEAEAQARKAEAEMRKAEAEALQARIRELEAELARRQG
jgi:Uma2 family endonuclease